MTFWDGNRWVPDAPAPDSARARRGRHVLGVAAEALLITGLIFGLIASSTLAAKGGRRAAETGTISMVPMDSTDGLVHYGQRVTFDVFTTATDSPFVHLRCSQAGTLVQEGYQGFFPNAIGHPWFLLGSTPLWQAGEADCTATLEKYTRKGMRLLATTTFHVEP